MTKEGPENQEGMTLVLLPKQIRNRTLAKAHDRAPPQPPYTVRPPSLVDAWSHLGLGMYREAQQPMVHLKGQRVAPGLQVLLPQKGGHAGQDLENESQSSSVPPARAMRKGSSF